MSNQARHVLDVASAFLVDRRPVYTEDGADPYLEELFLGLVADTPSLGLDADTPFLDLDANTPVLGLVADTPVLGLDADTPFLDLVA